MIITFKKLLSILLILCSSFLFLTSNVFANQLLPLLDFVGNFYYCDGIRRGEAWCTERGSPRNSEQFNYSLELYIAAITGVNYLDLSFESDPAHDPILNAWIEIGTVYNDAYPDNFTFGNTQPSGGRTGPVNFTITDGTNIYLTATLDFFLVEGFSSLLLLNPNFNVGNIYNVQFNDSAPYSRYIEELKSRNEPYNLAMSFTFYTYIDDFTLDAFGSISGKLVTGDLQDNDDDGYPDIVDCDDNNPLIHPNAVEHCFDSVDNDCDGRIDSDDSDCGACIPTSAKEKQIQCSDGIDNDCDGKIDCADKKDCRRDPACK